MIPTNLYALFANRIAFTKHSHGAIILDKNVNVNYAWVSSSTVFFGLWKITKNNE